MGEPFLGWEGAGEGKFPSIHLYKTLMVVAVLEVYI
jgi:hypothetical protein